MDKRLVVIAALLGVVACRTTKPGTDVQVVDDNGTKKYVGGAAGPGMNQGLACDTAVNRAVAAIALRFTQDNDDLSDDVATEVGVQDGRVFLERYARARLQSASVQDTTFNPGEHLCMATVRWTPPVFVKDAVKEYAEQLKTEEQGGTKPPVDTAPAATTTPSATATPPAAVSPTQAAPANPNNEPVGSSSASGAPATATSPATAAAPACPRERDRLRKADDALQKAQDELTECMRRTTNNTTTCTRYQLYVDQAKQKDDSAKQTLDRCTSR